MATYHAIGKRLVDPQLNNHAGYGDATVTRLADDLAVDRLLLYRAMALARSDPDSPPESGLRWSHYREPRTEKTYVGWIRRFILFQSSGSSTGPKHDGSHPVTFFRR
ncbi:MAG: hypothetical protein JRI68_21155 [Deltaproteobacteria bacterium]|nr:hypothetical protein [Deltaproteobacteria bacterium]